MMAAQTIAAAASDAGGGRDGGRTIGALEDSRGMGANGAVMPLAAALAWVKGAAPGAELVYATGHLPAWSKTPKAMRDLAMRDIVVLFWDRTRKPKAYLARRTRLAYSEPTQPRRIAREIAPCIDDMARLLEVLTAEAAAGLPCSYNRDLAIKAGLSDADRASYIIKRLVADGAILREDSLWMPFRKVTIVATGDSTFLYEGVTR